MLHGSGQQFVNRMSVRSAIEDSGQDDEKRGLETERVELPEFRSFVDFLKKLFVRDRKVVECKVAVKALDSGGYRAAY